jgi:putative addiction module CopG family antidote
MAQSVELGNLESVVNQLVESGRYNSKSEVLREGVRLVEERKSASRRLTRRWREGWPMSRRGECALPKMCSTNSKRNIAAWPKSAVYETRLH